MKEYIQQFNYLAIELLERLGNYEPTELQIEVMESILSQIIPSWRMADKGLTAIEIISLLLTAKGKTTREIADGLNISQISVEEYYEEIKNKFILIT